MRKYILLSICISCITACSPKAPLQVLEVAETTARPAPGVVEYVYEQPMVDVIEVPAGLDPEGVYYMPSHQTIVEIKQGRWEYYQGQ